MKDMEKDLEMEEICETEESITANRYGVVRVTPYTNHYLLVFCDDEGHWFYSSDESDSYAPRGLYLIGKFVIYMIADEGVFLLKELYCDFLHDDLIDIIEEDLLDYVEIDEEQLEKYFERGWDIGEEHLENYARREWDIVRISGDI